MYSDPIDRMTTLCLACSSSLPPLKGTVASSVNGNLIHITNCCQKPICPSCISSNPRLAKYNPCLACLAGVDLVGLGSPNKLDLKGKMSLSPRFGPDYNVDGLTRDQDTFVLGDDEDEDEAPSSEQASVAQNHNTPPPLYEEISADSQNMVEPAQSSSNPGDVSPSLRPILEGQSATNDVERMTPYKYYLNKRDTVQGICLRFGLDGHEICKLNNLPFSVIRTTPHLLHTRSYLLLPASAKPHPSLTISDREEKIRVENLVRERAEKKLQTLTKEVDWRVAKAYVALADDAHEQETFSTKRKEIGVSRTISDARTATGLEALAIERYLDDDEWEAEQVRVGRRPQILPLPINGKPVAVQKVARWWDLKK